MSEISPLYEITWFLGGVFVYRIIASILNLTHMAVLVKQVNLRAILLLSGAIEDLAFIKQIKYKNMEDTNFPEEQIKITKLYDEKLFDIWKDTAILRVRETWPKSFQSLADFETWEIAIKNMEKWYKEQLWKKIK